MTLSALGWDDFFATSFRPYSTAGFVPARIALEHKHAYELLSPPGTLSAACTGKFLHSAVSRADLPAVGDWVALRLRPGESHGDIHAVLPRRTQFSRRAPGESAVEQIVAANVDTVFLVTGLDDNYSLRRIERYLTLAWESGAQPVVLLNKSDLQADAAAMRAEVETIAIGAPVLALSATHDDPSAALAPWLEAGKTVAFLGSSGVGKSTLINRLLGTDRQVTQAISDVVGKGRHTTTHRELIVTPSGALVMDTPGMRELQLWEVADGALDATFTDVTGLAARCRFGDCAHRSEPGCAIQAALGDGSLDSARWQSFQKLQREQAYAARKADPALARELRASWKKINKTQRERYRFEGK